MLMNKWLNEARGSGSFDYKFWFWAKKGSSYGIGYARQNIKLDVGDTDVQEIKVKSNTKRLQGIADLFSSPIVIHWLNGDPPSVQSIPKYKDGDVTDKDGKHLKILDIFRDPDISEFVTNVLDWNLVDINDSSGDTLNTIISKFIKATFAGKSTGKKRSVARTSGLESVMKNLNFENNGVNVKSFSSTDYNILPKQMLGSKKIIGKLSDIKEKNFSKLLQKAKSAF